MLDVSAGDVFSFYTRSRSLTYGPEVMNVMLSTTGGGDASAFDVTLASGVEIPVDYTAYEYDLSAYAGTQIRVAIQCISDDVYALMTLQHQLFISLLVQLSMIILVRLILVQLVRVKPVLLCGTTTTQRFRP